MQLKKTINDLKLRRGRIRGGFPAGVLVDPEDEWLGQSFTWRINSDGYVCTTAWFNGKYFCLLLHRAIMWPQPDEQVDHRFHNRLDNRRSMLKCATHSQNNFNRRSATARSKTGIRGVSRRRSGFIAQAQFAGKNRWSKVVATVEEATALAAQFRIEVQL